MNWNQLRVEEEIERFVRISESNRFDHGAIDPLKVVTFGNFSSLNIRVIPYRGEQYKENCKENIIRIIFERKGGLGNMRNIFVVRNINHSIDQ